MEVQCKGTFEVARKVSNFSSTYRVSTLHMGRTEMLILKACCSVCGEHANLFLALKNPFKSSRKRNESSQNYNSELLWIGDNPNIWVTL
jgi:hypothetical protein